MTLAEWFSDRSHFTTGKYARDKNGNAVSSSSPDAACTCLMGGIWKWYDPDDWSEVITKVFNEVVKRKMRCKRDSVKQMESNLVKINDRYGWETVLEIVTAAGV